MAKVQRKAGGLRITCALVAPCTTRTTIQAGVKEMTNGISTCFCMPYFTVV